MSPGPSCAPAECHATRAEISTLEHHEALVGGFANESLSAGVVGHCPLRKAFCGVDGVCGAQLPGTSTLAFTDQHHLSFAGSYYAWPYLCQCLKALVS